MDPTDEALSGKVRQIYPPSKSKFNTIPEASGHWHTRQWRTVTLEGQEANTVSPNTGPIYCLGRVSRQQRRGN